MKKAIHLLWLTVALLLPMLGAAQAPAPRVVNLEQLQARLAVQSDTVYVVNLWATWCKPCVAELPHFESMPTRHGADKVKVILVSTDFASDFDKKLVPFVKKRQLQSEVLLLDETDYNSMIRAIHPEWSGALPATLLLHNASASTAFHEGSFTEEELDTFYQTFIQKIP